MPQTYLSHQHVFFSVTRLASQTQRADRFIGMHYESGPNDEVGQVLEASPSDATFAQVKSLAEAMGKVTTSRDYVANRILMLMTQRAYFIRL